MNKHKKLAIAIPRPGKSPYIFIFDYIIHINYRLMFSRGLIYQNM